MIGNMMDDNVSVVCGQCGTKSNAQDYQDGFEDGADYGGGDDGGGGE